MIEADVVEAPAKVRSEQVLRQLRERALSAASAEVEKTVRKLGQSPEIEPRLREMAEKIVAALLAPAAQRLQTEEAPDVSATAIEIFGLPR